MRKKSLKITTVPILLVIVPPTLSILDALSKTAGARTASWESEILSGEPLQCTSGMRGYNLIFVEKKCREERDICS